MGGGGRASGCGRAGVPTLTVEGEVRLCESINGDASRRGDVRRGRLKLRNDALGQCREARDKERLRVRPRRPVSCFPLAHGRRQAQTTVLLTGDCDVPGQVLSSRRGSKVEEREERLPEGHVVVRCEREAEEGRESPQCVVHARLGGVAKQEPAAPGGGEEREARDEAVSTRRPHATPSLDELRAADGEPEHDDAGIFFEE